MTNDDNQHLDEWALHAYADDELSADQRAEVEALMARDPEAARKVADWKRQRELLKSVFDGVRDEPVPPQLAAALRQRPARLPPMAPWLAMAAAVLLLLFGGLAGWFLKGESAGMAVADIGQQALVAHSVYAVEVRHPVEIDGSDKEHLQSWLTKRVGASFVVPDLTAEGYKLLGGRLLADADGPAGLLMYEDQKGERLSVLLATTSTDLETGMKVREEGKLISCTWQDGHLTVAVTAEMAHDPMMTLAKTVYEKVEG